MHFDDVPDDKPYMSWFSTRESPAAHVRFKFSPQIFVRFAEVLGFDESIVTFHEQLYVADGSPRLAPMFTVVSTRSAESYTTALGADR